MRPVRVRRWARSRTGVARRPEGDVTGDGVAVGRGPRPTSPRARSPAPAPRSPRPRPRRGGPGARARGPRRARRRPTPRRPRPGGRRAWRRPGRGPTGSPAEPAASARPAAPRQHPRSISPPNLTPAPRSPTGSTAASDRSLSCRALTVARHPGQLRRCGRASVICAAVASPSTIADSTGCQRRHSAPGLDALEALQEALAPLGQAAVDLRRRPARGIWAISA